MKARSLTIRPVFQAAALVIVLAWAPSGDAQVVPQIAPVPQPLALPYRLGIDSRSIVLGDRLLPWNPPGPPVPKVGLQITRVDPGGPAQRAGLEVGDVVLSANNVPIAAPDDLRAVIARSGGVLRLLVRDVRSGSRMALIVILEPTGAWAAAGSPPGGRVVTLAGTLRRGVVAVGAETTGTTLTAGGVVYELDLRSRRDLEGLADRLDGKVAIASGWLTERRGVEVPRRRIVVVFGLAEGMPGPLAGAAKPVDPRGGPGGQPARKDRPQTPTRPGRAAPGTVDRHVVPARPNSADGHAEPGAGPPPPVDPGGRA